MQFVLPLQEDGVSQRHSTTLHIMLAFLLFGMGAASIGLFWFTWISPVFKKTGGAYMPFIFFGIAALVGSIAILLLSIYQKNWLRQERNNLLFRTLELILLATGSILFFLNGWKMPGSLFALMSLVVVFAIVREKRAKKAGEVVIEDTGIRALNRSLPWKDIEAVLLRFGTLTIEIKGNKLIQQNIASNIVDAKELEAFCKEKIEVNKVIVVEEEW